MLASADSDLRVFVKLGRGAERVLDVERDGLHHLSLAAGDDLIVPRPLAFGVAEGVAYLATTFLELGGPQNWTAAGAGLARMHRRGEARFGHERDNTIGATPQPNQPSDDWRDFFLEQRLAYMLERSTREGARYPKAEAMKSLAEELLAEHQPSPAPVHGDLWSGNFGFTSTGPAVYDPAFHFADREVDLAMTRLFGGFPRAFYRGYEEVWPLPAGHERRAVLYNLYHVLNHHVLFGGFYESQANQMMADLLQG